MTLPAAHYETGVDVLVLLAPDESAYGRVRSLLATTEVRQIVFPTFRDARSDIDGIADKISLLAEEHNCAILYREEAYRFRSGITEVVLDTEMAKEKGAFAVDVTTAGNRFLFLYGDCGAAYAENGRWTQVLAVSGDTYFMPNMARIVLYGSGVNRGPPADDGISGGELYRCRRIYRRIWSRRRSGGDIELSADALKKKIKSGKLGGAYLFYGDEEYLKDHYLGQTPPRGGDVSFAGIQSYCF